jgi:hypothetical protein
MADPFTCGKQTSRNERPHQSLFSLLLEIESRILSFRPDSENSREVNVFKALDKAPSLSQTCRVISCHRLLRNER